jgi:hypothetical protein
MIGVASPKSDPRPVDIGYSQAASQAFSTYLSPYIPSGKPFRFIYTSGILSEKDQNKCLWYNSMGRYSRGAGEVAIRKFGDEHKEAYTGVVVRPGLVLRNEWAAWIMGKSYAIKLQWLALVMLGIAKDGGESRIVENAELITLGRELARNDLGVRI